MDVNTLTNAVANYGFPMLVSWYLLVRMEGKLDKLSGNIEKLTNVLANFSILPGQNSNHPVLRSCSVSTFRPWLP